ncbi:hypothetical protein E5676_scaffold874G00320 [Cucumis melo var. makuwa]|uniref:Uncharacterized protein n=2 Tax=Cucumis melo TaxID=3656 RepID=A0A5D3CKN9_CUCMM|nr:hypothetical protein E6C27_scaffold98G001490 [Cucumis melo var. makuwa]TYK10996.1 hypothetical protein E5676_scaffold874G00320 [Cucumis melo var. makuwa]
MPMPLVKQNVEQKGHLAEIFKVDNKGRKGCLKIPESIELIGWRSFFNMLNYKEETEKYLLQKCKPAEVLTLPPPHRNRHRREEC